MTIAQVKSARHKNKLRYIGLVKCNSVSESIERERIKAARELNRKRKTNK